MHRGIIHLTVTMLRLLFSDSSQISARYERDMDWVYRICGRGTQDMKCVSIQYIEALRKLYADDLNPPASL